jgi:membrane protein implicated in regulation of membrane protease activity
MDTMPGSTAVVVEQVNVEQGMVRIDGEFWQARSLEGSVTYAPGEKVWITEINGGTAVVWRDDLSGTTKLQP